RRDQQLLLRTSQRGHGEILGRQNRRRFPFRNKITPTNYPHTQNRQRRLGGRRSTGKHPRFARSETWTCVVPTTAVFQTGPENSRILPHTVNGCEKEGIRVQTGNLAERLDLPTAREA